MLILNIVEGEGMQIGVEELSNMVAVLNERSSDVNLPSGQINVRITDDAEVRSLNQQFAGNDYATDVLSFSYIEDGVPMDGEIGDVAISLDQASAQAKAAGTSIEAEIALLALHGVLHVAGYDHATASDQIQLDTIQKQVMTEAKLPYRDFAWA